MAEVFTTEEHPLPAVLLHWAHLVSFLTLAVTGLVIYYAPGLWSIEVFRNFHFVMMFVFIYTTIIRIYWAFFGKGSADTGQTKLIPDYKHFALDKASWREFVPWVKYYTFMSKYKPTTSKYGTMQIMTYGYAFPLLILCMALTGFSLWEPTQPYLGWFINLFSSLDTLRVVHLLGCWAMLAVFFIHFYLVLFEEPGQAATMLFRFVPSRHRGADKSAGSVAGAAKD